MSDMVNQPPHYNQGDIECIQAIEASMTPLEFLGYLKGSIIKYTWRYRYKDAPIEDLEKANWYLARLMKCVDKTPTPNEKPELSPTFTELDVRPVISQRECTKGGRNCKVCTELYGEDATD